jgi:hypothetical protein
MGRRDEAQDIIRVGIDHAQSAGDMKARSELETLLQTIS